MKKIEKHIVFESFDSPKELEKKEYELYKKAKDSCKNAYAPYSNFKVACCILLENGETILSTNQENIAYPSGLCAERVALFYAGSAYPTIPIDTIFIYAEGDLLDVKKYLSPCGACRQVMVESQLRQTSNFKIFLCGNDAKVLLAKSIGDLMPFAFGVE